MKRAHRVIAVILSALLCSCATEVLPIGASVVTGTGKQVVRTELGGLTPKQAATAVSRTVLSQLATLGIQIGTYVATNYVEDRLGIRVKAQK